MSNLNITLYPPDTLCFTARQLFSEDEFNCTASNFTVTQSMLTFLNLTSNEKLYRQAYCIAPPSDDTCAFGYCPNADIAGPLVRIASYITNICLSLLIFYSPERAKEAFWSQVLSIYAVLITCAISIFQTSLTRFHAGIAVVLTGSPLTFYLFIYSLMSFWYKKHRLNTIVGEGQLLRRILILIAAAIWISLLIYILVPTTISHFAQESCDTQLVPLANYLYVFPFRVISALKQVPWIFVVIIGTFVTIVLSWIIGIFLQRETIWPRGERWQPRFWTYLVLAMFVALPPLIQTLMLYQILFDWFRSLTWVRKLLNLKHNERSEQDDTINLVTSIAPTAGRDVDDGWKSRANTGDYSSIYKYDPYEPTHRRSKVSGEFH
ncbi:hypothetical protein QCA50_013283 [Cerrena zonata]|uniref:G-protein coupled receptors family 2 profile 2 domain-containing protein n=1 Tax=Cerrena zonata TaxID=2478898 RepID=A0AAW0FRP9_9APHY